jgi:hypothetical protein
MVWGGSLNREGSNYIRMLRDAENSISFLEKIKENLNSEEQENLLKTIEIISNFISKISEKKE